MEALAFSFLNVVLLAIGIIVELLLFEFGEQLLQR